MDFFFFLHFIYLFIFTFFIVVQVQFSDFPPYPSPPHQPSPPPYLGSTPLVIVQMFFVIILANPSNFSPIIPSPPLSGHCQPVLNFSVLVIFCLLTPFVDWVPVKHEIIWYLSFTTWLKSLSIMLSSSIHAVRKCRSSFFLSAA